MKSLRWKVLLLCVLILSVGLWIYFGELGPAPPTRYPSDLARKNGDVVSFENIYKLDRFIENSKLPGAETVRIASYTIEGDAILYDLFREDGILTLRIDNTRDQYSTSRKIDELKITDIYKKTIEDVDYYFALLDTGQELILHSSDK